MLNEAISIALEAHRDQKDKNGEYYILHPLAVMGMMDTIEERVVAVLHDVVEDTPCTLEDLSLIFVFPKYIINAINAITKRDTETYFDYIRRVKRNPLATKVKLADLKHNSLLERQFEKSGMLIERYLKAYRILKGE